MAETVYKERAILVGLELKRRRSREEGAFAHLTTEESLDELEALARGAGAEVVGRVIQARPSPDPATLIGRGKVEELARLVEHHQVNLVIFDDDLTPAQHRNLEDALDCRVVDRTQLTLDIFARRARTREGQLQVELAQLTYLLPRLVGRGKELSRLGGGIGTRGPGETKLETDRRRIANRIKKIKEELAHVRLTREVQRQRRRDVPLATVSLVGYTNVGKSTIFNRLTGARTLVDDRYFATLDPTVRVVQLPSHRRILLSDTVGFIRKLPTTVIEAFRATLEEVQEATLILHVVDASSPHCIHHVAQVRHVLSEIGVSQTPQLLVLNKIDRLVDGRTHDGLTLDQLEDRLIVEAGPSVQPPAIRISALKGQGLELLLEAIDQRLHFDPVCRAVFRIPLSEGAKLHLLHELGRVESARYDADCCEITARVPQSVKNKLIHYLVQT